MERDSMFMDRKIQYCQDVSSPQLDLQIECNFYQKENPATYFVNIDNLILKLIWRGKSLRIANTIWKEKNQVGGLTLSDFKTYYKATVIKIVWYW